MDRSISHWVQSSFLRESTHLPSPSFNTSCSVTLFMMLCDTGFFPRVPELLACHIDGMFCVLKILCAFHTDFYHEFSSEGVCFEKVCLKKTIATLKG